MDFSCLELGQVVDPCELCTERSGSIKFKGISLLCEELLAS